MKNLAYEMNNFRSNITPRRVVPSFKRQYAILAIVFAFAILFAMAEMNGFTLSKLKFSKEINQRFDFDRRNLME